MGNSGIFSRTPNRTNGFTLIELMVSLTILATLLSAGVPAMTKFFQRNQANTMIGEVRTLVALTRESAVRHGCLATLCPSEDSLSCSSNTQAPLMVFSDCNGNRVIDDNDQLYRTMGSLPDNSDLRWSFFPRYKYIQMTPQGRSNEQNGTLIYCPASGENTHIRALIISKSGRTRYAKDTDGDDIPNRAGKNKPNIKC